MALTLFVFLVSCDSYCFVTLRLDAVGWYAVSNYGISLSYSLFFSTGRIKRHKSCPFEFPLCLFTGNPFVPDMDNNPMIWLGTLSKLNNFSRTQIKQLL